MLALFSIYVDRQYLKLVCFPLDLLSSSISGQFIFVCMFAIWSFLSFFIITKQNFRCFYPWLSPCLCLLFVQLQFCVLCTYIYIDIYLCVCVSREQLHYFLVKQSLKHIDFKIMVRRRKIKMASLAM